jgi:hypothetical protein
MKANTLQPDSVSRRATAPGLTTVALLTFVALYLTWAAFHDIAHGEADLTTEYACLGISAAWLTYVAAYLIRVRHRVLGVASLAAVGAGVWGQRAVGPVAANGLSLATIAVASAFLWFLLLTGVLAVLNWQARREQRTGITA